jgi:hypothetical protein
VKFWPRANCAAQGGERRLALSGRGERESELVVGRRPARLPRTQLLQALEGGGQITAGALRDAEQQQRRRMIRRHLENLGGLLGRECRLDGQQPCGVAHCSCAAAAAGTRPAAAAGQGSGASRGTIHTQPTRPNRLTKAATRNAAVE